MIHVPEGFDEDIIENQLERTDHDHLGKLLTYLTAFDADRAIWVTADPRPEHVKAVAWLNDSTPASFHLFDWSGVTVDGVFDDVVMQFCKLANGLEGFFVGGGHGVRQAPVD